MASAYVAKPLGPGQIDQAFPVVQTLAPDLKVERWRAFAAAALSPPGGGGAGEDPARDAGVPRPRGILTVQNGRGYIHGLFSYQVEESLRHGRTLAVENFIVLDLFDLAGAAEALLGGMDRTAQGLACTAIHTTLPDDYAKLSDYCSWVLACFREAGHGVETLRLCKRLAPAPLRRPVLVRAWGGPGADRGRT
jgi:hypothetical protein